MTPPARIARVIAAGAVVIAVAALILLAMGRNLFYENGPFSLWSFDAWGPENSQQLFDPYSFTHVIHGILYYALLRLLAPGLPATTRGLLAVTIESGWEILENSPMVIDRYRTGTFALGYYGDSVINSVGDIIACAVGFTLAARLPTRGTAVVAIAIELVLLLWIRDNLTLNIVMLIHPVDAVKQWQLGP